MTPEEKFYEAIQKYNKAVKRDALERNNELEEIIEEKKFEEALKKYKKAVRADAELRNQDIEIELLQATNNRADLEEEYQNNIWLIHAIDHEEEIFFITNQNYQDNHLLHHLPLLNLNLFDMFIGMIREKQKETIDRLVNAGYSLNLENIIESMKDLINSMLNKNSSNTENQEDVKNKKNEEQTKEKYIKNSAHELVENLIGKIITQEEYDSQLMQIRSSFPELDDSEFDEYQNNLLLIHSIDHDDSEHYSLNLPARNDHLFQMLLTYFNNGHEEILGALIEQGYSFAIDNLFDRLANENNIEGLIYLLYNHYLLDLYNLLSLGDHQRYLDVSYLEFTDLNSFILSNFDSINFSNDMIIEYNDNTFISALRNHLSGLNIELNEEEITLQEAADIYNIEIHIFHNENFIINRNEEFLITHVDPESGSPESTLILYSPTESGLYYRMLSAEREDSSNSLLEETDSEGSEDDSEGSQDVNELSEDDQNFLVPDTGFFYSITFANSVTNVRNSYSSEEISPQVIDVSGILTTAAVVPAAANCG